MAPLKPPSSAKVAAPTAFTLTNASTSGPTNATSAPQDWGAPSGANVANPMTFNMNTASSSGSSKQKSGPRDWGTVKEPGRDRQISKPKRQKETTIYEEDLLPVFAPMPQEQAEALAQFEGSLATQLSQTPNVPKQSSYAPSAPIEKDPGPKDWGTVQEPGRDRQVSKPKRQKDGSIDPRDITPVFVPMPQEQAKALAQFEASIAVKPSSSGSSSQSSAMEQQKPLPSFSSIVKGKMKELPPTGPAKQENDVKQPGYVLPSLPKTPPTSTPISYFAKALTDESAKATQQAKQENDAKQPGYVLPSLPKTPPTSTPISFFAKALTDESAKAPQAPQKASGTAEADNVEPANKQDNELKQPEHVLPSLPKTLPTSSPVFSFAKVLTDASAAMPQQSSGAAAVANAGPAMTNPASMRQVKMNPAIMNPSQVPQVNVNPAMTKPSQVQQSQAAPSRPIVQLSQPAAPLSQVQRLFRNAMPDPNPWLDEIKIRQFALQNPIAFATAIGLYFQDPGATHPMTIAASRATVLGTFDQLDPRRQDLLAANPNDPSIDKWEMPNDVEFMEIMHAFAARETAFKDAIFWYSQGNQDLTIKILKKAGWTRGLDIYRMQAVGIIDSIFKMPESKERDAKVARAKAESPRLFEWCYRDLFIGTYQYEVSTPEDPVYLKRKYSHTFGIRGPGQYILEVGGEERSRKRTYRMDEGRPMQVHSVPEDECAFDSKGNRLPWALEWADDHPRARGQKRRVEEKGPFGKANRRKGSSRTRTTTPAKKENPTLENFDKALNRDFHKHTTSPSERQQNVQSRLAATNEPTEVILYGYQESLQWQALRTFENISHGMICEDYDREPPAVLQRYPSSFVNSPRQRPLTKEEKAMVFKFAGGANWVKVTFNSAAAANRAIAASPIDINSHWVYAQQFHGSGPDVDEPIPTTEEERAQGKPLRKNPLRQLNGFKVNDTGEQQPNGTSATASTATATGTHQLNGRHRNQGAAKQHPQGQQIIRRFPGIPPLRPAHEAFLPQPTWWERQVAWLTERGLIPGEIIGDGPPTLENGDFDHARASFYWRFFFFIDSHFGTDLCGLRDDEDL